MNLNYDEKMSDCVESFRKKLVGIEIIQWNKNLVKQVEQTSSENDFTKFTAPVLTNEARDEILKKIEKFSEEFKIAIRKIRQDFNKVADDTIKQKDILKATKQKIQLKTDFYTQKVEQIAEEKSKHIIKMGFNAHKRGL